MRIINLLSPLCRLLPVRKNKLLFWSYSGSSYSCNPRYLCEYLLKHHPDDFELVWMFSNKAAIPDDLSPRIRVVRFRSFRWFYDLATAGVVVSNCRIPISYGFRRRAQQQYIQTWHGSVALKMIEQDAESTLAPNYVRNARHDSAQASCVISGNAFNSELFRRAFWYDGPVMECGTPRIDYLLEAAFRRSDLCAKAHLKPDIRYVLYAPTFRRDLSQEVYSADLERLASAVTRRFGGEWRVLFRLHPNLLPRMGEKKLPACCEDVTRYQDMQELLVIADVLLTDYSSSMFDMAYCSKPVFLYACDIHEYTSSDRGLYFDIQSLPFPLAQNNDELEEAILHFDENEYQEKLRVFMDGIGSVENGTSCKKITETLLRVHP